MRPQSDIRVDTAAALVDGPGTTHQLAQRTGWSIGLTRRVLDNMCTAGDAHKPHSVRVAGVKRSVPVYARAVRLVDAAAAAQAAPVLSLIAAWAHGAQGAAMEADM